MTRRAYMTEEPHDIIDIHLPYDDYRDLKENAVTEFDLSKRAQFKKYKPGMFARIQNENQPSFYRMIVTIRGGVVVFSRFP